MIAENAGSETGAPPDEIEVIVFEWRTGRRIARMTCVNLEVADVLASVQSRGGKVAMVYQGAALRVWYRDGAEKFHAFPAAEMAARAAVQTYLPIVGATVDAEVWGE